MTLLESTSGESLREGSTPVLETERLILRAPRLEDAKAIAALANDRRIAENTRIPHPYRLNDAEEFVAASRDPAEPAFAVALRDGPVIGMAGLTFHSEASPELGYWLGTPYWGNGYATEAAHAVIDYAFDDCGHQALLAGARVSNPASRRVLEKCGFQWAGVGLYRIHSIASSAPVDRFRLDRGLWVSLKTWSQVRRSA